MFLRMMIINDLHIRVICMLIVWIYYLNVSSNFLSLIDML
ncbi:putative membrane protein [Parabacteroides distasonis str. 3776 Po2 i]|nr:putative membrane protein [Parabacteroides distasonis str. 3776 Po2 i]